MDRMQIGLEVLKREQEAEEQREKELQEVVAMAAAAPDTLQVKEVDSHERGPSGESDGSPRSRSTTPVRPVTASVTGVGTQTGTPPPSLPKDDSHNSISSTTLPKKDSQTSLYHSVHTSFDHGSDDEKKKEEDKRDTPSPPRITRKTGSGSDDDKKSDMATQTEITGDEVATKTRSSNVSVKATSSDESTISSPTSSTAMPCVKVDMIQELSPDSKAKDISKSGTSPNSSKNKLAVKKKRRKKIERKRREMFKDNTFTNVDEANEGDNSSVDGQTDEMLFEMELSGEESYPDLSMSRTVSMPIIDDHRRLMVGEWASSQRASAFHPFSDGDITPIMRSVSSGFHLLHQLCHKFPSWNNSFD